MYVLQFLQVRSITEITEQLQFSRCRTDTMHPPIAIYNLHPCMHAFIYVPHGCVTFPVMQQDARCATGYVTGCPDTQPSTSFVRLCNGTAGCITGRLVPLHNFLCERYSNQLIFCLQSYLHMHVVN